MAKKILVADGSITIQKIVAMAFEREDTIVEGTSNGKDALDRMENFRPDIVLADVDMPGLTGFELSKKIKNNPKATAQLNQLIKSQPENDLIKKAAQSQLKVMEWEKENTNAL